MKASKRWWVWVIGLVLGVLLVPFLILVLGVLLVVPTRVERSTGLAGPPGPVIQYGEAISATISPVPASAAAGVATPDARSPGDQRAGPTALSLDPQSRLNLFVVLPLVAIGALSAEAGLVWLGLAFWRRLQRRAGAPREAGGQVETSEWTRYALVGLVFWVGLSAFLVLDLLASVSVYLQVVAIYAAFWVLVGALITHGRPVRERVLVLGLFAALLLSTRFVNWNSRKPFLKDFARVEEGMSAAQVTQIMDGYEMWVNPAAEVEPEGTVWAGNVTFRHTHEAWGDSDVVMVKIDGGQVVATELMSD